MLFVDQDESIRRQLSRGKVAQHHNEIVKQTGVGKFMSVRGTDVDPELAK